jgi:hypothetical protein
LPPTPEDLIRVAADLLDRIATRAETDEAAFREAYRLGFESGVLVGRRQLDEELSAADRHRAAHVTEIAVRPAHTELEHIRWDGPRADFGRPRPGDFPGMP